MPASALFFSSGDLIADRRYDYARGLADDGDREAAADLLAQALELVPGFASAWFLLGEVRAALGDRDGAVDAFRSALAADRDDRHGAGLQLARLGAADPAAAMAPAYVRTLFDQYAPRFDQALTGGLGYRGPQLLTAAIDAACRTRGRGPHFGRAVDLGCGTGLAGRLFRRRVDSLVGVDLSPGMIEEARRAGAYDRLDVAEMLAFLRHETDGGADLILAADALVYVADLAPVLGEAARVLAPGGFLAVTVETHAGDGVILGAKLRYAHAAAVVREAVAAAGLTLVSLADASTRTEAGVPVPGLVAVAARD